MLPKKYFIRMQAHSTVFNLHKLVFALKNNYIQYHLHLGILSFGSVFLQALTNQSYNYIK